MIYPGPAYGDKLNLRANANKSRTAMNGITGGKKPPVAPANTTKNNSVHRIKDPMASKN